MSRPSASASAREQLARRRLGEAHQDVVALQFEALAVGRFHLQEASLSVGMVPVLKAPSSSKSRFMGWLGWKTFNYSQAGGRPGRKRRAGAASGQRPVFDETADQIEQQSSS